MHKLLVMNGKICPDFKKIRFKENLTEKKYNRFKKILNYPMMKEKAKNN